MSPAMFPAGISTPALMNSAQGREFGCSGNKSLLPELSGETQYGDGVGEHSTSNHSRTTKMVSMNPRRLSLKRTVHWRLREPF